MSAEEVLNEVLLGAGHVFVSGSSWLVFLFGILCEFNE